MLEKICEACGNEFTTNQQKARFCSDRCRISSHRNSKEQLGNLIPTPPPTQSIMPMVNSDQSYYVMDLREQLSNARNEIKELQKENKDLTKERDQLQVKVNTSELQKELEIKQLKAEINLAAKNTFSGVTDSLGGKDGVVEIIGLVKDFFIEKNQPKVTLPTNYIALEGVDRNVSGFLKGLLPFLKSFSTEEFNQFKDIVDALVGQPDYIGQLHSSIFQQETATNNNDKQA
jgi:regulator of replication initiation timing